MAGELGKVIRKLRDQARMRQADLSKQCNVKQPNLSRIEKGRCEPRHATLLRIAEALGTTVETLETEAAKLASMSWPLPRSGMPPGSAPNPRTMVIPVFDTSAGYSIDFDDGGHPLGVSDITIEVPLVDVPCFACRVYGDSMTASGQDSFAQGDIVVFAERQPRSGDFAFVRTLDLSGFKQVFFEHGFVRLVPLNRAYEEKTLPSNELVHAWKLVQHFRMFK